MRPCPPFAPALDPSVRRVAARRDGERGFTLLELVAVMIILMILIGVAISQLRGSKKVAYFRSGVATATVYADAVEAFMADNGQTPPAIGSADWPQVARGPLNRLLVDASGKPRAYARTTPEHVQDGLVVVGPPGVAPGAAQATVEYSVIGKDYLFVVKTVGTSPERCFMTNAVTPPPASAGMKRC